MTRMLASVTSVAEARMARETGADIIDLKNPAAGALGALPLATVAAIVASINGLRPVSATIGDLPDMHPAEALARVEAMAATGVDFVKVGLFPAPALGAAVDTLGDMTDRIHLVAVLFADRMPDFGWVDILADRGFKGVMLDTAGKDGRGLRDHLADATLANFVARARARGLFTGLAGSLGIDDIAPLVRLHPDYLGFRGALCEGHARTRSLAPERIRAVRNALDVSACEQAGEI